MRSEKLTYEEFVKKAIVSLRTDNNEGIHNIRSAFNDAFKKYFNDIEPSKILYQLESEGKISLQSVNDGLIISLKNDDSFASDNIIIEFIEALDQEIDAIKNGKGGNIVKIFNGQFIREISGFFVYVFALENFLTVLDESPAEIEVHGKRYQAQIFLTQGLKVEIGIESSLGPFIPEATLNTKLWYLLELLKKKYLECREGTVKSSFMLSNMLFSGRQVESTSQSRTQIQYSLSKDPPNKAQQQAIESSFLSKLSIIWGPPGTGKTKTIAKIIEAHLNADRRILLVSHANNAVDEALEDVAEHLKTSSFYQEGKLIRLGKPQEEHLKILESNYELVLIDKVASKLGESLVLEKNRLEEKKLFIEDVLQQFVELFQGVENIDSITSDLTALKATLSEKTKDLSNVHQKIRKLEVVKKLNQSKLFEAKSAGIVKKFFKGLDPKKIQYQIDQANISINSVNRQITELNKYLLDLKTSYATKENNLEDTKLRVKNLKSQVSAYIGNVIVECPKCKTKNRVPQSMSHLKTALCGECEEKLPMDSKIKKEYSLEELKSIKTNYVNRKKEIIERIAEINNQLDEIQKKILTDAKLVATTLTKTFISKQFPEKLFDVLILDEASMAPLPHLYWAASRCSNFVSIVGDFLQLPPICISDESMAQKWLGRSIFTVLGINSIKKASTDPRIKLLDTQYRMVPDISKISNNLFYQNKLKDHSSTFNLKLNDGLSDNPLVLIDTSEMNPWCSRLSTGSRFNLYNALVCTTLAKQLIENTSDIRIGIATPYGAQARLINKIAKDWGLLDRLRISTIHRFQGGEEPIIIFDSVEGTGTRIAPMLDDTKADSDAQLILNVAITRSKNRFYFIGHIKHLLSQLHPDSSLAKIIHHLFDNAEEFDSEDFVDNYLTTDFEKWAEALLSTTEPLHKPISGNLFTEKNFWNQFFHDLKTVEKRLIILSPFVSIKRSSHLIEYFRAMINRGVEVRIYTKPRKEQIGQMTDQADAVIEQFCNIGVKVKERVKMHHKIAILDEFITWEGSLNILSHRDTGEQMRRFEGQMSAEEVIRNLELDKETAAGDFTDKECPQCGSPMIMRRSRYGEFLSCSKYPRCKGKIDLKRKYRSRKSKKRSRFY